MTASTRWLNDPHDPEVEDAQEDWRALTKAEEIGFALAKRPEIKAAFASGHMGERDLSLLFRHHGPYHSALRHHALRQYQREVGAFRATTDLWLKWVALIEQQNLNRTILESRWAEAAERATGEHRAAEAGRLTHDYLRRSSIAVMGAMAIAQVIYVITGVVLVHPALVGLFLLVAASFYWMSRLMNAEVDRALRQRSRPAPTARKS